MSEGLISKEELVALGYSTSYSQKIISEARKLLVSRGYSFYAGKRLMIVPRSVVSEILGVKL